MKKIITAFLLLLASFQISHAEPTKAVKYLMNEPVSMFDWGLYKLKERLDVHAWDRINNCTPSAHATYDWNSNRIRIIFSYYFTIDSKEELVKIKNQVEYVIRRIKKYVFGLDMIPGKPLQSRDSSLYLYFSNTGYEKKPKPENLAKELDQITEIVVEVEYKKYSDSVMVYPDLIKCYSPLLGKDIFWSEKKLKATDRE